MSKYVSDYIDDFVVLTSRFAEEVKKYTSAKEINENEELISFLEEKYNDFSLIVDIVEVVGKSGVIEKYYANKFDDTNDILFMIADNLRGMKKDY